jgi:glucose/arabinose dehydrogenase
MEHAKEKRGAYGSCRFLYVFEENPVMKRIFSCIAVLLLTTPVGVSGAPAIDLQPVVTGIDRPVAITNAGDGSGRLFITLRPGFVVVMGSQGLNSTPFLDISALTTTDVERGLLSIAFHPNYRTNGFFYVNYTNLNGDTVIARYHVSANPDAADPGSAAILLTIPQPFANHNGGQLQFGPDGYLYIGIGDGGSGGDPQNNAQNLGTLLGKMLRIDVDSSFPYAVPADNPFLTTSGARPEIWAYGLRNPWRFSFDRDTGDLFIGDVGQDSFEEVDFQTAGSAGGQNYGWRLMEGTHCFNPASNCNNGSLTLPVIEYPHAAGDCSISGGYRYRGTASPDLSGIYFYGDFCTGKIWGATEITPGVFTSELISDTGLSITSFGEDEEGELYVAHFASPSGAVYQVKQATAVQTGSSGGGGGGACFIGSLR